MESEVHEMRDMLVLYMTVHQCPCTVTEPLVAAFTGCEHDSTMNHLNAVFR